MENAGMSYDDFLKAQPIGYPRVYVLSGDWGEFKMFCMRIDKYKKPAPPDADKDPEHEFSLVPGRVGFDRYILALGANGTDKDNEGRGLLVNEGLLIVDIKVVDNQTVAVESATRDYKIFSEEVFRCYVYMKSVEEECSMTDYYNRMSRQEKRLFGRPREVKKRFYTIVESLFSIATDVIESDPDESGGYRKMYVSDGEKDREVEGFDFDAYHPGVPRK